MARKKQEIALQQEIETQEEWEEALTKEGLIVIDVYQEWAGPCKSMVANFRRIRNETSDNLLRFAMAKADTIDSLERYRGSCEPCFLFYGGGCLVAVIRGANAPTLSKAVINELAKEHKVLNGEAERVEIRDPKFAHLDSDKSGEEDSDIEKSDEVEMVPKEVTVALLKPDIVKEGKADEVLAKLEASGIEILKHEERQLGEDEAKDFYSHLKDEPFFDELIQFMCSGPSHVLLLSKPDTGKGIIDEWRELIGPTKVEDAKEQAPDSLRAQYGTKDMLNALHGSDTQQSAARELAFFFPEYQVPTVPKAGQRPTAQKVAQRGVQRTLALIRPDALVDKKDEILHRISESGFEIALQKEIQLNREQAEGFYSEHKDQPYFEELITKMTGGPVLALGLAREDAIQEWRKLLGPTSVTQAKEEAPESLRAQYSVDGTEVNMLHGSDSPQKAQEELNYFFPVQKTVAVIKPDAYDNKDHIVEKIKEAGFHVAARKETTLTKDIAEMLYKQNSGQEYYDDLIDHMTSGPTLFMVLTKEDAVENWRGILGPTDPMQAKDQAPDSLRAQFGTDVKANALHGASNEQSAKEVIEELFGVIETKSDGHIDPESDGNEASQPKEGVELAPAPQDEQPDTAAEPASIAEGEETEAAAMPADEEAAADASGESSADDKPADAAAEPSADQDVEAAAAAAPAAPAEEQQAAQATEEPPADAPPGADDSAAETAEPKEEAASDEAAAPEQSVAEGGETAPPSEEEPAAAPADAAAADAAPADAAPADAAPAEEPVAAEAAEASAEASAEPEADKSDEPATESAPAAEDKQESDGEKTTPAEEKAPAADDTQAAAAEGNVPPAADA